MKPRYALQTDHNQQEIIDALRQIGCSVIPIGLPVDLLVGYRAKTFLIECKNTNTDYGKKNRSTKEQRAFFTTWRGQVRICSSPDEAIELVTKAYKKAPIETGA